MAASASLRSWSRSAIGGHPICHLVEGHGRRHRDVERVGMDGDAHGFQRLVQAGPRQLAALRTQDQDHRPRYIDITQFALRRRVESELLALELVERRTGRWSLENRTHRGT